MPELLGWFILLQYLTRPEYKKKVEFKNQGLIQLNFIQEENLEYIWCSNSCKGSTSKSLTGKQSWKLIKMYADLPHQWNWHDIYLGPNFLERWGNDLEVVQSIRDRTYWMAPFHTRRDSTKVIQEKVNKGKNQTWILTPRSGLLPWHHPASQEE